MITKPAETEHPILPLLRERWSPRAFDERAITPAEILTLMEAARWSPSAGNGQPWSFIVAPREDQETFERLVGVLNEGNVIWARNAPLLIVSVAHLLRSDGQANPVALYDVGQAVAHLSVQAASQALWVHQMAGFDADRLRAAFAIPEGFQPVTVIAVGHQGNHAQLPDNLREREQAPRSRKALDAFVFGGSWGVPFA